MSRLTDALHEFMLASSEYSRACEDAHASRYDVDCTVETLTQAGDALERELVAFVAELILNPEARKR